MNVIIKLGDADLSEKPADKGKQRSVEKAADDGKPADERKQGGDD